MLYYTCVIIWLCMGRPPFWAGPVHAPTVLTHPRRVCACLSPSLAPSAVSVLLFDMPVFDMPYYISLSCD